MVGEVEAVPPPGGEGVREALSESEGETEGEPEGRGEAVERREREEKRDALEFGEAEGSTEGEAGALPMAVRETVTVGVRVLQGVEEERGLPVGCKVAE